MGGVGGPRLSQALFSWPSSCMLAAGPCHAIPLAACPRSSLSPPEASGRPATEFPACRLVSGRREVRASRQPLLWPENGPRLSWGSGHTLPRVLTPCSLWSDNLAAVTLAISSCLELVKDALEEMEQVGREGGCFGLPGAKAQPLPELESKERPSPLARGRGSYARGEL